MQETEITVQIFEDLKTIQEKLEQQGFKLLENYQINDYYFSKYDFVRDMPYAEMIRNSFLVRDIIDDHPKVLLTYKDKKYDKNGTVISEEKTKARVSSLDEALEIFNKAGLNQWCNIYQDLFVFAKGEFQFAIQAVKDLGIFLEYEEENIHDISGQETIDKMIANVNSLGLNCGDDYCCKKVLMKIQQENKNK